MIKIKNFILILILVTGAILSGCIGKKTGDVAAPTEPAATPGTTVSEQDLNTNDLNDIDSLFNDSSAGDMIDVGVNESTFT